MSQQTAIDLRSSDSEGSSADDCAPSAFKKIKRGNDDSGKSSPTVRLNVGGVHYEVARDTLMRYEGSMLARLISGKWKEGNGEKSEIFMDRDGGMFQYVLEYLRTGQVYLPDHLNSSALQEEFDYFGIDADMSNVLMKNDFLAVRQLANEIKGYEEIIKQKRNKMEAIKESYRLASEFTNRGESQGLYLRHDIRYNVDKELLRDCLLSRGLYVVAYDNRESGEPTAHICTLAMKDKVAKK